MSKPRHGYDRAACPACSKLVCRNASGRFRHHGPKGHPCQGTGRTVVEAQALSPHNALTGHQLETLREAWRTGDWIPVEQELGIKFPAYAMRGDNPDEELRHLVRCVRHWLEGIVRTGGVAKAHTA